ncbi:uncharacterized protein LOC129584357 isoform X1 [Paramacrobiotus metropolitanus]|uniref:uncharacterized protein LOC129584357 isoform X1 n=1 Tax=Paramacrobiotus metropolitanus TaxID=2943436 RepID=UPI00244659B6|nr:uncharacterized protein LOC129584357 isoform X1 [Paramacrobiotus metropolitanus]
MFTKAASIFLVACIAFSYADQAQPKAQQGQKAAAPPAAQGQAAQGQAQQGQAQAGQAQAPKSEIQGAKDEFIGGVAAIGDSAARVGQAVVNKAKGVRDNMENAGSQIAQTWSQSAQNTKDIIKNIGNTDNAPAPAQKQ